MKNEDEATDKVDEPTKSVAAVPADNQEMEDNSAEVSDVVVDTTRRVMFETDDWEKCITEAVWFG